MRSLAQRGATGRSAITWRSCRGGLRFAYRPFIGRDSIRTIGRTVNAEAEAEKLMAEMKQSLQNIQEQTLPLRRPDVLCLEWLDPLMSAGNWMPEIVQLAGGNPLAATAGKHSPKLQWERVLRLNPD